MSRSSRKTSAGSNSAATSTQSNIGDSKASSGTATPIRKISAQDFDRGELDELPVIDQESRSFITEGTSTAADLEILMSQRSN